MKAITDMKAIRGATTIDINTPEEITLRTQELMNAIYEKNQLNNQNYKIVSIIISTTPDITALYPAAVIRHMGYDNVALFSSTEPDIDNSLPMCIRILINLISYGDEIIPKHIYLREAKRLRPDLVEE